MNESLDLGFLDRTLRTTAIVLLIFLPFGLYYLGVFPTLAVFSGGVWGLLNFVFISALVRSTVRPEGPNKHRAAALLLFKFPLLYLSGYFLLKVPQFDALPLVAGFTTLFAIMILKALGRMFLALDDKEQPKERVPKAL